MRPATWVRCGNVMLALFGASLFFSASAFGQSIVQQAQLLPFGSAGDEAGYSVAIDGDTMVVGAPYDDVDGNVNQGSAYVYGRVDGVWVLQARLAPDVAGPDLLFGFAVDVHGDRIVVGAPHHASPGVGKAHFFVRTGDNWVRHWTEEGPVGSALGFSVGVFGDTAVVGIPLQETGGIRIVRRLGGGVGVQNNTWEGGSDYRVGYSVAIGAEWIAVGAPLAPGNSHAEQGIVLTLRYSAVSDVWLTGPILTPAAGVAGERFGNSVALDGSTLVVGAYAKNSWRGTAYVFTVSASTWAEQATLTANDGASGDQFGWDVAVEGDTVLVGAPKDHVGAAADEGSVYVYTRSGTTWTQRAHGTGVAAAANDNSGWSVALSGTTAVVGAPFDDVGSAASQGSVTVFTGSGATWTPAAWLGGSWPEEPPRFGKAMAVSGDTLLVGACGDMGNGAVYVFVKAGVAWALQARLVAEDAAPGDYFGDAVAIAGDTLVVGASWEDGGAANGGAAYVFTRTGGAWTQRAKLLASDAAALDLFGSAVAITPGRIVVGAPYKDAGTAQTVGTAYVFEGSGATWVERAVLRAPSTEADAAFGHDVAIDLDTVLVGAPGQPVGGVSGVGAAYVFTRSAESWTWQATLPSSSVEQGARCGVAVALEGDTALAGCEGATVGALTDAGVVQSFVRSGTAWTAGTSLVPDDPQSACWFGHAVALEEDTAVVGAPGCDGTRGALYAFTRVSGTWRQAGRVLAANGRGSDQFGVSAAVSGDGAFGGSTGLVAGVVSGCAATVSGLCRFGIIPAPFSAAAAGGSQAVAVNAGSLSCAWSTTSGAAWLTFIPPGTGTGDGAVTVQVGTNTGPARSGTMTIAGQTFTVNQASGCSFTLTSGPAAADASGGSGSVAFTASNAACSWAAASNVPWMSITSATSGTGGASVGYSVLPNAGPARTGTLTLAGQTFTVTQASGCTYGLTASSAAIVSAGGASSVGITTSDAACGWGTASHAAWVTITSAPSGVGPGTISYSVASNRGPARSGTLTLGGQAFTVNQAGGCTFSLTATTVAVSSLGGFPFVALLASDNACPWSATSNVPWAALTNAPSGTGSTTLSMAVEPNTGAARSGTITAAGLALTVNQSAWGCSFGVSPLSVSSPAEGGTSTLSITSSHAGCTWTAAAGTWITFPNGGSGSGGATLAYLVAPNYLASERQGSISVGGYVVQVTQAASTCTYAVSRGALDFAVGGGSQAIDILPSGSNCAWAVTGLPLWLNVSPTSGSGPATLSVTALSNVDTVRTATLAIASQTLPVNQAGSPTPSAPTTAYLAEGATSSFFDTQIALVNPGNVDAEVTLRYLRAVGAPVSETLTVPALQRATVWPERLLGTAEFSTVVESSHRVVVDRTMVWDDRGYGAHAETAVAAPALTWYLAEGATHSGFDLFYLVQNPNDIEAALEVRYLRPAPLPVITKSYEVPANSRFNIWVNLEGAELASTDVAGVVQVTNGMPVIVERAMYLNAPGHPFDAGHESAGITQPATTWFLAEGATLAPFDLFILVANPNPDSATVRLTYLLTDGTTYGKTVEVAGNSRMNVWVNYETPDGTTGYPLSNTVMSTTASSINDVPIIVERSMWWPRTGGGWREAHNSPGTTATGTLWALAEGEEGGQRGAQTYILVANTSPYAGAATVTLLFDDGTTASRSFALPPSSRTNVAVAAEFPASANKRFGALIESTGEPAARIVVERAMYWDSEGVWWAAGTNAAGTLLR